MYVDNLYVEKGSADSSSPDTFRVALAADGRWFLISSVGHRTDIQISTVTYASQGNRIQ